MGKKILAVIAGTFIGWTIVFTGEMIAHLMHAPPAGFDFNDQEAVKQLMASMPASAFLFLVFVWGLSSFGGGLLTALIVKDDWKKLALITGSILLLGAIINMFMVPHPLWVNVLTILIYIPAAYFGGKLAGRKRKPVE